MSYTYTILETEEIINQHTTFEYDDDGIEVPGTEIIWTTKTVKTKVEYDFPGYGKHSVNISHFNPQSNDDIELGISNRAVTEKRKLNID